MLKRKNKRLNREIKIAFLTATDPTDRKSWSGIHSCMFETLKSHFPNTVAVGPLEGGFALQKGRFKSLFNKMLLHKRYDYSHSKSLSKHYAKLIEKKLKELQPDLIFSPTGSTLIAYLKTNIPIISLSDATVKTMIGYYEGYTNLTVASEKEAIDIERRNINNSSVCLYPSEWAANSAINDFGAHPEKIKIFPLGANFRKIPSANELNFDKPMDIVKFLFLGVEWERKGGKLVIETMKKLKENGIPSELTICGCTPTIDENLEIKIIPFIDKNTPEGEKKIGELFQKSHYLFLPSKAECFGIVFCEASSFGIPSLTFNTGGIGGAIQDGINGYKAKNYAPEEFISWITDHKNNPNKYTSLAKSSRKLFDEKLNWNSWLEAVIPIIENTTKARK